MVSEFDRCDLLFQEFGLSRIEGRILSVLLAGNPLSARDIETAADLRQPEISKGAEKLLNRGWIRYKTQNGIGKGRPEKIYCLLVEKIQIFAELRDISQIEYGKKEKNLSELEELLQVK